MASHIETIVRSVDLLNVQFEFVKNIEYSTPLQLRRLP
jgi:hypothetical protein